MPSFLHFNIFTQRIPNDHQRDKEICTVLRCESNIENKHDRIEQNAAQERKMKWNEKRWNAGKNANPEKKQLWPSIRHIIPKIDRIQETQRSHSRTHRTSHSTTQNMQNSLRENNSFNEKRNKTTAMTITAKRRARRNKKSTREVCLTLILNRVSHGRCGSAHRNTKAIFYMDGKVNPSNAHIESVRVSFWAIFIFVLFGAKFQ